MHEQKCEGCKGGLQSKQVTASLLIKKRGVLTGEWKIGMEPPGKRGWRVGEEDQRTMKHTSAKESRPGDVYA
eukprot:1138595-Pelagomonas_calceolata.AAC.1